MASAFDDSGYRMAPYTAGGPMRLYVKPKTQAYDSAVAILRLYGLHSVLQEDEQGTYFDMTPPEFWKKRRKLVFQRAVERLAAV
jgi:hypothetical protein